MHTPFVCMCTHTARIFASSYLYLRVYVCTSHIVYMRIRLQSNSGVSWSQNLVAQGSTSTVALLPPMVILAEGIGFSLDSISYRRR